VPVPTTAKYSLRLPLEVRVFLTRLVAYIKARK